MTNLVQFQEPFKCEKIYAVTKVRSQTMHYEWRHHITNQWPHIEVSCLQLIKLGLGKSENVSHIK